eukprot:scaffold3365_cov66-Phaeocystis_antarctica.AAC.1
MMVQYIKCPGRGPRSRRSERGCVSRVLHGAAGAAARRGGASRTVGRRGSNFPVSAFLGGRGAGGELRETEMRGTGDGRREWERKCAHKKSKWPTPTHVYTRTRYTRPNGVCELAESRERHQSSQAKHEVCGDEEHVPGEND